jgi:SET domain-containing protein
VVANGGGMIAVGASPGKGRGVFAQRRIVKGEEIELSPVVVVPQPQVEHLDQTVLGDYYFVWGQDEEHAALALGLCSLCNHSYQPNAVFILNSEKLTIEFVAARDIEAGQEITINYNGDPNSRKPIWFECLP